MNAVLAAVLTEVLAEAKGHGWIGRGSLEDQLSHSGAFAELLGEGPGVVFDLGSGGGLPALPAALVSPAWRWVLVEAQLRRVDHLASAVRRLELVGRVQVRHARAEEVGREGTDRGTADAVTARSFGPPAVVAECAAPLLRPGGRLVVSEPPGGSRRWPADALETFGLSPAEPRHVGGAAFVVLHQVTPCPGEFPRRPGRPGRHPRF
jgi:16S rRNA (guanine527-N7)-methyltransferase